MIGWPSGESQMMGAEGESRNVFSANLSGKRTVLIQKEAGSCMVFLVLDGCIDKVRDFPEPFFPQATSQTDMLAYPFGDCCEGQIPRCSAALQI